MRYYKKSKKRVERVDMQSPEVLKSMEEQDIFCCIDYSSCMGICAKNNRIRQGIVCPAVMHRNQLPKKIRKHKLPGE